VNCVLDVNCMLLQMEEQLQMKDGKMSELQEVCFSVVCLSIFNETIWSEKLQKIRTLSKSLFLYKFDCNLSLSFLCYLFVWVSFKFLDLITNSLYIATPFVVVLFLVWATYWKKPKAPSFQMGSGWNLPELFFK